MLLRARVIWVMIANILFKDYTKEMSLDSKYNRVEEFNEILISFLSVKTR